MNGTIQDWINGLAGHVHLLDTAMKLSATDLVFLAGPLLLALWFWPATSNVRSENQRICAATFFAVLLALALAAAPGYLDFDKPPFVSDAATKLLISHAADNSFPSEHAAVAFAVAGSLVWWRRSIGLICIMLASLVALARVYVGVHWPLDVVAGTCAGLVAGAVLRLLVPLFVGPQRWLARRLPAFLIAGA